jgi:hypothetical protein
MWRTVLLFVLACLPAAHALGRGSPVCRVAEPTANFHIRHVAGNPELTTDAEAPEWKEAASQTIVKDCSREIEYANIQSTVRSFWTDTDVYFLFECPYTELNLFLPANHAAPRVGLWDRDVVEMFLGDDWTNIRHYREFEIAPTGDWIDLAIDLDHENYDHSWWSGWKTAARIDDRRKIWYAAAQIPLTSISKVRIAAGSRWRMNLYRIEGLGADPQRHFLCWQPTCVINRDPNHVPEHFGTLVFETER